MMFRFLAYTNQPTTQYIGPLQPSTNNNSNGSSSNSSSVISSSPVVTSSAQSLPTATLISPQKQSAALATAAAIQQQQQYQHAYHSQQQQQQQQQQQATNGAHGSNAYHAAIAQAQAQLTAQMQAQQQAVALAQQQQQLNFLPQVRNQLYYHRHLKMFLFLSLDAIFYSTSCSTTNVLYNTQWSNNISIRWSKLYSCTSTWSNNDHRSSSYVFCWSCFTQWCHTTTSISISTASRLSNNCCYWSTDCGCISND
jgi:hypothetical protein